MLFWPLWWVGAIAGMLYLYLKYNPKAALRYIIKKSIKDKNQIKVATMISEWKPIPKEYDSVVSDLFNAMINAGYMWVWTLNNLKSNSK